MRKRIWQFHSWLGLVAGLGLVVIGLSGSLLVFHDEIEGLINPGLTRVEPVSTGRLPLSTLIASANRQLSGYEVAGWSLLAEAPDRADFLYVRQHGGKEWLIASANPYTGEILASPRKGETTFTGWMLELHYTLLADHAGVLVAGILAAGLFLLGLSGVYLYRDFWKNLFTLRWGRSRRILFSDMHKFVGITSVAFNLILGFTGAYWNIPHAAADLFVDHEEEEKPTPSGRLYNETLPWDALVADTANQVPGFTANYLSLPTAKELPVVTFYGAVPGFLRGSYGSTVSYDAATGAFKEKADVRDAGVWARVVDSFMPLHYGTFGGLTVKILWTIGGLTPGVLAITGFFMWWLRRPGSRRNKTPAPA